jgi:hypothetical protein
MNISVIYAILNTMNATDIKTIMGNFISTIEADMDTTDITVTKAIKNITGI